MPISFWVSAALIVVDLLAGIAVGVGIHFEGGEPNTPKERFGAKLVIYGVVIEALAGFVLFGFDGYQSQKQQGEIVAEARTIDDQAGKLREAATNAGIAKSEAGAARAAAKSAITNAATAKSGASAATRESTAAKDVAGDAFRNAAKADRAAADALIQIASAQSKLEALAKENAEFEDAILPRFLDQFALARKLSQFPAVPFFIMEPPLPYRDQSFTESFIRVFAISPFGKPLPHITSVSDDGKSLPEGINIEAVQGTTAYDAAMALCVALADQKLDVEFSGMPLKMVSRFWPTNIPQDGVLIRIGRKETRFFFNKMLINEGQPPTNDAKVMEEQMWKRIQERTPPNLPPIPKYPFCG